MGHIDKRVCERLEDCISRYNLKGTDYSKGVLCGMWQLADSIRNQMLMDGKTNKKLDKLIDKAEHLIDQG